MTRLYPKELHIRITTKQDKFIHDDVKTDYSQFVRKLIDARQETHDKVLEQLEAEFALLEPKYFDVKKRIEEKKIEIKRLEDEKKTKEKRIQEAHEKLLEALKRYNWKPERIQKSTFKVYSDFTGESIENLVAWVNEMAKRREELE